MRFSGQKWLKKRMERASSFLNICLRDNLSGQRLRYVAVENAGSVCGLATNRVQHAKGSDFMIRKVLLLAAGVTVLAGTAAAQTNVGVTVDINQPGVYGRISIGNVPPPVVYRQPIIIAPQPVAVAVQPQPVYMKVPPGHAKKWRKHCHKYNACGEPVYFVQTDEYKGRGKGHGKGHGKGRED
jgi:hypothetical protein